MSFFNCTQEKHMRMQLETQMKILKQPGKRARSQFYHRALPVRMNKHNKLTEIREGVAGVVELGQS